MYDNKDILYLESIDTILDLIVNEIIKTVSAFTVIDVREKNFIELNRFERANIIYINFQNNREAFINKDIKGRATLLVDIIYDSLSKSELLVATTPSELAYLRENSVEDEDSFLFNNNLFSWFDYSYNGDNRRNFISIVENILKKNSCNIIYELNNIDLALYNELTNNPKLLQSLNWRVFEKLLADILSTFEYDIELLRGTKDGGIDIVALKKDSPLGIHRYLIQAKRWKNKVGVEPVRSLIWAHNDYRVTKSCLATTSLFTKGAWELANNYRWQVELKDYHKILEWIDSAKKIKTSSLII